MEKVSRIDSLFDKKKVLFITTKNLDYIRNEQEVQLVSEKALSVKVIGSSKNNYFSRLVYVYIKILFQSMRDFDIVFVGFAPQLVVPFWKLKFRKRILVIDFFVSMYDTFACDRKKVKEKSFCAKALHWIDKKTLDYADEIITDTKTHGDFFCKEFGTSINKIHILYLRANKSVYYPRAQKKETGKENKFVVLYFGTILPLQGVDIIIKAIELLKDKKNIFFYVIGPVDSRLKKTEQRNVEYINWLSQEELANYIAMADLCLAGHFSGEIEKAKRTIPGKAYIYEAMGKKMLLGDNMANRELFEENDGKYFVQMGNPQALADKIVKIMEER